MKSGVRSRESEARSKNPSHKLVVPLSNAGSRLDVFLAESRIGISRSFAKQLIDKGNVEVRHKKAKASLHVEEGDVVTVTIPPPELYEVEAEELPLEIIYEDRDIIVVNKPVGMVVHPAVGNPKGTLVNALLAHCKDLSGIGGELKPGIVHRLDKGTSGVIVAAKNDEAHLSLSKQFKDRTVTKIYGALVYGSPKGDSGVIDKPIGRSMKDRKRMSTRTTRGRIAHTEWKVIERFEKYLSWLEVNLGTGRTHQIRVHLSEIGHPLVGDDTYGRGGANRVKAGSLRKLIETFKRPALHAWKLGFNHPRTGKHMEFTADIPKDLTQLITELRRTVGQ